MAGQGNVQQKQGGIMFMQKTFDPKLVRMFYDAERFLYAFDKRKRFWKCDVLQLKWIPLAPVPINVGYKRIHFSGANSILVFPKTNRWTIFYRYNIQLDTWQKEIL